MSADLPTRENLLRALNAQPYLDDIREACERIMRYSQGLDLNQFVQDEKTFDAVVRNLEVIGEAAKHIPPEIRACYPDVEWNKLAGLRDIVAHKYFGLDEDISNVSSDLREPEQVTLPADTRSRHTTYELALLSMVL